MRIGVLDYGVGNLGSVLRALEDLRASPILVSRAIDTYNMDALILPGVGNFSDCARLLRMGNWPTVLRDEVQEGGKPLLGICVGMQLLADYSVEGAIDEIGTRTEGLGFVPGHVEHLRTLGCRSRTPHVGWNSVVPQIPRDPLFNQIPSGTDFYFVHSYAFVATDPRDVIATSDYDVPFAAALRRRNVWGCQFHPEKSSRAGSQLLRNFVEGFSC